jgi:hypothetical protein
LNISIGASSPGRRPASHTGGAARPGLSGPSASNARSTRAASAWAAPDDARRTSCALWLSRSNKSSWLNRQWVPAASSATWIAC